VYRIKFVCVASGELKRIILVKLKRIMPLRLVIHAHNLKSCQVITHCGTACSTEQI